MNFLRMPLLFVLALVAHWTWSTYFSFLGLSPQILLVLTVVAAARFGAITAMCFGFAWGLFLDTFQVHLFGSNALALTIVGYLVGSVRRQIDVTGVGSLCVMVLGMTWGYFLLLGLLGLVFMKNFLWVGWPVFMIDPFYNCLIIPAAFVAWGVAGPAK